VEALAQKRRLSSTTVQHELSVRHATNTPWWWGLLILLQVGGACLGQVGPFGGGQPQCEGQPGICMCQGSVYRARWPLLAPRPLLGGLQSWIFPPSCRWGAQLLSCAAPCPITAPHPPQYRTFHNYTSLSFLSARLADKVLMGLTIMTLYWGIGAC
jgi:hypothetical protein